MFKGLQGRQGNVAVTARPPKRPERAFLTITGGTFIYAAQQGREHLFQHLDGILSGIGGIDGGGDIEVSLATGSGRDVVVTLPRDGWQTHSLILALASIPSFRGRTIGIDVAPYETSSGVASNVTVTEGGKRVPWAVSRETIPAVRRYVKDGKTYTDASARTEFIMALARIVVDRIAQEASEAETDPGRVAPDIDDVPEGL